MAKLSLYEVKQAQLEQIPKVDGQLIVISDTGSIYRDIAVNGIVDRILIGNDIIAVDELPLAPISNKIYYLKPNKLYTYNSGWIDLTGGGSDIVQTQPDYNQNDSTQPDYIKNRPFYEGSLLIEIPSDVSTLTKVDSQVLEAVGIAFNVVKVAECFSSSTDVLGAKVQFTASGSSKEFTVVEDYIEVLTNGFSATVMESTGFYPLFINVTEAGTSTLSTAGMLGEDMVYTFEETGLYFFYVEGMGQTDYYEKADIKKIDKKYLPDTLPEVTTDDNGKFLCVDNGVWAIKSLSEWTGGSY